MADADLRPAELQDVAGGFRVLLDFAGSLQDNPGVEKLEIDIRKIFEHSSVSSS